VEAARIGGDSMHPTIPPESIVVVDMNDRQFINNKIYAVNQPEAGLDILAVKRVTTWANGYLLVSDNIDHPAQDGGPNWERLVVGRVIWMWRSLLDA
jgi:phage repressor protein C with HTH and peptisase S24 domain